MSTQTNHDLDANKTTDRSSDWRNNQNTRDISSFIGSTFKKQKKEKKIYIKKKTTTKCIVKL